MAGGERTVRIKFDGAAAPGLEKATEGAKRSIEGVAESTDNLDTKAAGATSALGALSSGFELVGLQGFADGLNSAAMATDFFSGVGEGLTLILESQALASLRAKVATAAHAVATVASTIAQRAAALASRAWAAAQWLLNAAMSANPIGLVAIAIVALIAIFVIAWKRSETFRRIVTAAWHGIQAAAQAVAAWFRGTLLPVLSAVWHGIQAGASFMVRAVGAYLHGWVVTATTVKNAIVRAFDAVVGFFRKMPGRIASATRGLFDGIKHAFRSAVNWIIGRWNNLSFRLGGKHVSLPFGKSFDIPSVTLSTPNIGYLASGGAALAGRTYMVGERGPELLTMGRTSGLVTPNNALGGVTEVHVYLGDQELRGLVRTEVRTVNRDLYRTAAAGTGGTR